MLTLVALLAVGPPEGWVALRPDSITADVLQCANWSRREWAVRPSADGVRPVPASDERRQDPLPFSVNFRGAIPFPGDLPDQKGAAATLDWQFPPEEEAKLRKLEPPPSPGQIEWALKYGEKFARRYVVHLSGGWLIAYAGGEFGGSLWWYPTPTAGQRIGVGNVVDIISVGQGREALVFAGLAHMGIDQGRVFRFTPAPERHELRLVADLKAAPQVAIAESTESALVLTTQMLWRVAAEGSAETLCALDTSHLYPRSMVAVPSGEVWVGMRHFVARLLPAGGGSCPVQWFARADCATLMRTRTEGECACRK